MEENLEDTIVLENLKEKSKKIFIKDKELNKLIQFKIQKDEITKTDLSDITEIILNGQTITKNKNEIYFDEIDLFPNLKKIEINNAEISNENIKKLKNIEDISFRNCTIEKIEDIKNAKKISIKSSKLENIQEIAELKNITDLELVNIKIEKFDFLTNLTNLKILKIKNIEKFCMEKINFILPIEYLSLEGIEKLEIKILENYKNLKTLSIEREKQEEWKNILKEIENKNIKILLNDIYEY